MSPDNHFSLKLRYKCETFRIYQLAPKKKKRKKILHWIERFRSLLNQNLIIFWEKAIYYVQTSVHFEKRCWENSAVRKKIKFCYNISINLNVPSVCMLMWKTICCGKCQLVLHLHIVQNAGLYYTLLLKYNSIK